MTPSVELSGELSGCPCGRSHPSTGRFIRRQPRKPSERLDAKLIEALWAEKAVCHNGVWWVRYCGDCTEPVVVSQHSVTHKLAKLLTRCRKCKSCLRARTNYWGYAAMNETLKASSEGRRTWFGTLTLSPEAQQDLETRARLASPDPNAEWWTEHHCDERFAWLRRELIGDVQRFWKRLRKQGHQFKYICVFERHKSGLPHVHFLLHETGKPITKRAVQAQWRLGFSNISIVGGKSRNAAAPEKASFYVVKYLSKSYQSRQLASRDYRPMKGSLGDIATSDDVVA